MEFTFIARVCCLLVNLSKSSHGLSIDDKKQVKVRWMMMLRIKAMYVHLMTGTANYGVRWRCGVIHTFCLTSSEMSSKEAIGAGPSWRCFFLETATRGAFASVSSLLCTLYSSPSDVSSISLVSDWCSAVLVDFIISTFSSTFSGRHVISVFIVFIPRNGHLLRSTRREERYNCGFVQFIVFILMMLQRCFRW